ncbi:MAG TPA: type II toxin-antitoxin system RelE/ParE family toxin [Panacibacter sp.]|nr:type II toxin-antitoxin system RelE/ParE family toxin [Panacibacter sp.]
MAQRIIILKRADQKVKQVYAYLLENWNQKVADEFYEKFEKVIHIISLQPEIGRASAKRPDIRRKLVTKHNCLYYRIKDDSIIIINMLDTRRDPVKNPYE